MRFASQVGIPLRTYRRHQARPRDGRPPKGPWPAPVRSAHRDVVLAHATAHPAWSHRKVWAMVRHDGYRLSQSTVARLLDEEGLLLKADYQRERRELAKARKAAFTAPPTGPNQVWQLDFSEYETAHGGTWRVAAVIDLLVQIRVRLAPVTDREPARRDSGRRARPHRSATSPRQRPAAGAPDRPGLRRGRPDHARDRQRECVPVLPLRRAHHRSARTASHPNPGPNPRAERRWRARLPDAEIRASLPRGDR